MSSSSGGLPETLLPLRDDLFELPARPLDLFERRFAVRSGASLFRDHDVAHALEQPLGAPAARLRRGVGQIEFVNRRIVPNPPDQAEKLQKDRERQRQCVLDRPAEFAHDPAGEEIVIRGSGQGASGAFPAPPGAFFSGSVSAYIR